jgi:hypothetical protein
MKEVPVRFYVPQSRLSLLVSAENSHKSLSVSNILESTNQDIVAGKLNFDTIVAALLTMNYRYDYTEGPGSGIDYDVFERTQ